MAAGQDGDQSLLDRLLLAEDDLAELSAYQVDALAKILDQAGQVGRRRGAARTADLCRRPL